MDYEPPKNLKNAETQHMLAELWANKDIRMYLYNERNKNIRDMSGIELTNIEHAALQLSKLQGRKDQMDTLLMDMRLAYDTINKIEKGGVEDKKNQ